MNLLAEAVLVGAAAWRISSLLSTERGPFDIFLKFREFLEIGHNAKGEPDVWPDSFLPKMLSCVWCSSLYTAVGMWGLWQISQAAVIVIAASSTAIIIERWNRNG